MQIRHIFLLTLVIGLASSGNVFAHATGPDPGVNGIFGSTAAFTCAQSGCHSSFALNLSPGSVTVTGLPSSWAAGVTYPLTITVQKSGQLAFGFELSAVVDSTNQQAGSFTQGSGQRIQCGASEGIAGSCTTVGAIQFLEHSFPVDSDGTPSGSWTASWTAPSSTSAGTVRFNVAGNAANGDGFPTGDYIYTNVYRVAPATSADLTTHAFTIVDRGGTSVITDGSGALTVGYSRIEPASGNTTPAGVAIFGYRVGTPPSTTLVSEAGVPASPLLTSVRTYAEIAGSVDTGLAIANPNNQTANISFHFTDTSGSDFGFGTTTIAANGQTAAFLDQTPFLGLAGRNPLQGTFSFTSNVPVGVIALRLFVNERGEQLITTLPITDLSAATPGGTVYLPHYADGGGWTTQIVLANPTDTTITGTVQFFTQAGVPATLTANGQSSNSFTYSIPRESSFKIVTAGLSPPTLVGSVRVTGSNSTALPSSLAVFSFKPSGITVSEAGVQGVLGNTFRMYVEETGTGGVGAIQTGFAMASLAPAATTVNVDLLNLDGTSTGLTTAQVTIPGNGQVAKFVDQLFAGLTFPFKGILRITGGSGVSLSVVGLRGRYNERSDFLITTTPPSNENGTPPSAEFSFPHIVNGGGYTTQFILFSGTAGQATSGNMKFFKQDGTPLSLTLN